MKKFHLLSILLASFFLISLSSCDSERLSDLDIDIIGEWVVDDYILTGDNITTNGEVQDMHMVFNDAYEIEVSWFENGDFFAVDGTWSSNESDSTLDIELENRVFFFCNDDDISFNIFFFAFDMELDTDCGDDDWMEIQLERL